MKLINEVFSCLGENSCFDFQLLSIAMLFTLLFAGFLCVLQSENVFAASGAAKTCIVGDPVQVQAEDPFATSRPSINGVKVFYDGNIGDYSGKSEEVTSPIIDAATGKRAVIGRIALMTKDDITPVLESAKRAWNRGQGVWPQMSAADRIATIERVVFSLKLRRDEIVNTLMWEICKTLTDAQAEFDRTMIFIESLIKTFKEMDEKDGEWTRVGGIFAKIRRAAIGILLCLGPFNYPFNETYATLIPALLMGNVVIMKIPTTGGLAHILTMEAYANHLPPGTINFLVGSGRELLGPLMATGDIDALAFIGGSQAADQVIKAHPHPHRLKVFLQLEGKNLGIVLPDADLDVAAEQIVIGSTTYNGQRCTAVKLILVHASIAQAFIDKFVPRIANLGFGLPWSPSVAITPLPELKKIAYLTDLIEDAAEHGAKALTPCVIHGGLLRPTVMYPVNENMRLWHEEQFGPVIPVGIYNNSEELLKIIRNTPFGQQAALFTTYSSTYKNDTNMLVDALSTSVGRINLNTQCGRSPDTLPFSGRRSSAMGTMSVIESLRTFSIETVVAAKSNEVNERLLLELQQESKFLAPLEASRKTSEGEL